MLLKLYQQTILFWLIILSAATLAISQTIEMALQRGSAIARIAISQSSFEAPEQH
jgi:hypothetical protein